MVQMIIHKKLSIVSKAVKTNFKYHCHQRTVSKVLLNS